MGKHDGRYYTILTLHQEHLNFNSNETAKCLVD